MANPSSIGVPGIPQAPLQTGNSINPLWYDFFVRLWKRTGGASGSPSIILDNITSTVGSILYRGASQWLGLAPGAQSKVLRMGASFPEWDTLDGASFGSQAGNLFFVSPNGGAGPPTFRAVATQDLTPIAGQIPGTATNNSATAGNVGEYITGSATGVAVVNATPKDITSINLTAGDWDVWGSIATAPAGTTTTGIIRAWISATSATDPGAPNGGAYLLDQHTLGAGLAQLEPIGMMRITVPAGPAVTVFLSTAISFAVSTMAAAAFLGARRAR